MARRIDGLFKAEAIHRRDPWRSFEAFDYATLEWFDTRRLFEPNGSIPPAEAEANCHATPVTETEAAQPTKPSLRKTRGGLVVSPPVSPDGPDKVSRGTERLVGRNCIYGRRFLRLGIPAQRDDGMCADISDGIAAFVRIAGAVSGEAADLLIRRDMAQQFGQDRGVANMAAGDFDGSDIWCLLVDPKMHLAPETPFRTAMFACVSLAFIFYLDPGAIDQLIRRLFGISFRDVHDQRPLVACQ